MDQKEERSKKVDTASMVSRKKSCEGEPQRFVRGLRGFRQGEQGSASPLTDCYVVPSSFIYEFCKSWIDDSDKNKMVRLHISPAQIEQYRGAWDLIRDALKETEPNQVLQPAAAALGISAATE